MVGDAKVEVASHSPIVVRVFVDFWNFTLSVGRRVSVDWKRLGPWLATRAIEEATGSGANVRFDGMHVYLSYDPRKQNDGKLRHWATNVLDRFPGVELTMRERKAKAPPKCSECHQEILDCPHCTQQIRGSIEKGIDTAIVTDMIRLAWEESFDVAVLITSDRDFIPAVEFLHSKGRKVVNGWFPPRGADLARKCWANFDLNARLAEVGR